MINAVWYTNTSVKIVFVLGTAMIDPACGIFGRYQVDQMPVAQLVSDPTLHQMDASDQKDIKHCKINAIDPGQHKFVAKRNVSQLYPWVLEWL